QERKFYEVERWLRADTKLTYMLPKVGGGHKGGGRPGGKSGGGSPNKGGGESAAPRKGGLVYPGPQPIVSNPPNPTNRIQTILQPDLPKPPELKVPLPLPNVVLLKRGAPAPPPLVPKVNMAALPPVKPPEAPKLQADLRTRQLPYLLPVHQIAPPPEPPKLPLPPPTAEPRKVDLPFVPKVPTLPAEATRAAVPSDEAPTLALPTGAGGSDDRTLLALSPTPAPPGGPLDVPPGEAHGQFAMGPEPNLKGDSAHPGPGTENGTDTGAATSGNGTGAGGTGSGGAGSGLGQGEGGGGGGTGTGTGSGTGSGVGPGSGTGSGSGTGTGSGSGINGTGGGGTGSGTGTGSGSGPGRGHGSGEGLGTGSGSGSGSGSGPFTGISIAGASGPSGAAKGSSTSHSVQPGPRPSYGLTIVATAASGGGLRDYGVFRNESVFTVYIPMTHSPEPAPSWTFQYALLRKAAGSGSTITLAGNASI
ncbi:MAG: hypothetical protein ACREMG_12250, partial [Gemmatimonadales bacterium]